MKRAMQDTRKTKICLTWSICLPEKDSHRVSAAEVEGVLAHELARDLLKRILICRLSLFFLELRMDKTLLRVLH